ETLEILRLAWTQPSFSYEGKYHSFQNVSVTPKPYQQPYPELRMAAATPETFPQIGRLGLPIFVAVRQGPFTQLAEHIKAYRGAAARGRGGDRARRHPRGTELRRQNPAKAGGERAVPPLRRGQAAVPLIRWPRPSPPFRCERAGGSTRVGYLAVSRGTPSTDP